MSSSLSTGPRTSPAWHTLTRCSLQSDKKAIDAQPRSSSSDQQPSSMSSIMERSEPQNLKLMPAEGLSSATRGHRCMPCHLFSFSIISPSSPAQSRLSLVLASPTRPPFFRYHRWQSVQDRPSPRLLSDHSAVMSSADCRVSNVAVVRGTRMTRRGHLLADHGVQHRSSGKFCSRPHTTAPANITNAGSVPEESSEIQSAAHH